MPERADDQLRAFWSGTITFGLVTLPVGFLPANRPRGVSLRMLDEDGTPLRRRWWCPKEEELIDDDEIVRGYEVDDGKFVIVDDEELEALAPEKTKEIDLRRFVDREEVDPIFFERAYFLAPIGESVKAYRLLAQAMEDTDKVGVGTFVMRGKEYVIAVLADNGILRAEIMRFADEIRPPEEVGLPDRPSVPKAKAQAMARAVAAKRATTPKWTALEDRYAEKLDKLVERKLKKGEDVVEPPPEAEAEEEPEIIDIMDILKRSLEGKSASGGKRAPTARAGKKAKKKTAKKSRKKARKRA